MHGVTKSRTWLSVHTHTHTCVCIYICMYIYVWHTYIYVCHRIFLANLKLIALKTKDQPECVPGSASPTSLTDRQQISLWPLRCWLDLGPAFFFFKYSILLQVITDLLKKQAPAPATLVYNSLSRSESLEARNSEHTVNRKANHQFVSLIPQLWVQSQSCPLALQWIKFTESSLHLWTWPRARYYCIFRGRYYRAL